MTNNKNNQRNNNQQNPNAMREEFGAETDVNHVKQQNQRAEANKQQASGQRANNYQGGTK